MIEIAGLLKLTLIDYPGHLAATVFTRGCQMRCPFCYNRGLVLPDYYDPTIDCQEVLDFLNQRKNQLEGLVISGGEPTLQEGLVKFIDQVRAMGYKIKLDTNGLYPKRVKHLIDSGRLDYVAMDIKADLSQYAPASGLTSISKEKICQTIQLLHEKIVDYEFRSTLYTIHTNEVVEKMSWMLKEDDPYYLQRAIHTSTNIRQDWLELTKEDMLERLEVVRKHVKTAKLREL